MNKLIKQYIFQVFFLSEVLLILLVYIFGRYGLPALWSLKKENKLISQEIAHLSQEVARLENKCKEWQDYPFYKEKIAREHLQMARDGDYIFYIFKQKEEL
jgi:cell division protein FtsB